MADRNGDGSGPETADASSVDADGDDGATADAGTPEEVDSDSGEDLRREVEERYDFDDFGPEDMARMDVEEWEAAFDSDSWVTGPRLLNRVERDLRARIADRDVFAVVEREEFDGEPCLLAYSDEGYAAVYPDGTVEGRGTVLRDVKPSVALASMDSYEVPEVPPEAGELPSPEEVAEGSGELGNKVMQAVAAVQVLAGVFLLGAWLALGLSVIAPIVAVGFVLFGAFLFVVVANARLSDRFRAAEYRDRLRAARVESGERPPFVPGGDDETGPEHDGERAADAEDRRNPE
jgi:hypothetical protein